MPSYQEEIARMRMERKQAEARDQYEQLRQQYEYATEQRDNESLQIMSKGGDRSDYDYWDQQVEEAEQGLAPYIRAQQPQADPRMVDWARRHAAWFERHGQRAVAAFDDALGHVFRPKNSDNTINPAYTGQGFDPRQGFTPAVAKAVEDTLEMHAEMYHGINFDPKETSLTANEAANMSGLSPQEYNRASQTLAAQGRFNRDK